MLALAVVTIALGPPILPYAWRQKDQEGRACASCHSPDGIELALYAYDGTTLIRRATPHIGKGDAARLAQSILSVRQRLKIKPRDPMASRPMQPGGSPFPGASAVERDAAFARELLHLFPRLTGDPVADRAAAHVALSEVLAIDPTKMRVGIVMNRLSEDKFHGNDHASLAHWIPDVPPVQDTTALFAAEDRYLADPTLDALKAIDAVYCQAWRPSLPATEAIALEKARSLLRLQHFMRTGERLPIAPPDPVGLHPPTNPFWEIGEMARIYTNVGAAGMALPADVEAAKAGGPTLRQQMRQMRLPWLWLGWTYDPGLQRTAFDHPTRYAEWFSELLIEDGPYPAHAAVMLVKKLATEAYDPKAWCSGLPPHLTLNFVWLLRDDNWLTYRPRERAARRSYDRFIANSFRMFAILQTEELARTGVTLQRDSILQQLRGMRRAAQTLDPSTRDTAIFEAAARAVTTARFTPD